jgi:hypothetical protein
MSSFMEDGIQQQDYQCTGVLSKSHCTLELAYGQCLVRFSQLSTLQPFFSRNKNIMYRLKLCMGSSYKCFDETGATLLKLCH